MNTKLQAAILVILAVTAVFFSTYKLIESPPVWYDEGWYIQTSHNLVSQGIDGIQIAPGDIRHISILTVGYPLVYTLALWFKIFGIGIIEARSLMAVFIIGFLVVSYFFSRRLFGATVALGTLALLATFPPLYGNGKSVLGEVPGMLYFVSFLLCFSLALNSENKKRFWYILAGVFTGLCIVTKPIFLLILPGIAVAMIFSVIKKNISWKFAGVFIISLLIPIVVWFIAQFQTGDTLQTVLQFYANPYNSGNMLELVLTNVRALFTDPSTLFTVILMAIWTVGLGIRLRYKERIHVTEIISFVFSILVILAYLRIGYVYRYLLPAQIMALIFVPYSIQNICLYLANLTSLDRLRKLYIPALSVLALFGAYQLLFSSWVADSYASDKTAFWQEYFTRVPSSTSVFFYNTPEVVPFVNHRNYRQFLLAPAFKPTGSDQLVWLKKGDSDLVIVVTSTYEQNEGGIFNLYKEQEKAYKYSILRPR